VLVLGSTGSIGRQALEIVAAVPGLDLVGLAAERSAEAAVRQALSAGIRRVALRDESAARRARELTTSASSSGGMAAGAGADHVGALAGAGRADARPGARRMEVLAGEDGIAELIACSAADARRDNVPLTVLNGIVGAAGLRATMAVLESGATLALANKESLVAGGDFVLAAARRCGAQILPVDSEHSAVFQCLLAGRLPERPAGGAGAAAAACESSGGVEGPGRGAPGLDGRLLATERIVLTGSGGPFRGRTRAALAGVTPDQALRHPTWSMGRKITIDSATLMNKGLEVIEAHYLFGVPYEAIEVLVSPQSLMHALVRFADGATVAHLGLPDMRTPIAYALTYPDRAPLPMVEHLDLTQRSLTFERPDMETFGCLRLAYQAGRAGGAAPVVLNAANEVAVSAFLEGRIGFLDIEALVEEALAALANTPVRSLDDVFAADSEARRVAAAIVASGSCRR
jgi:1-deoxy-D-xylulose-5-phosphate reductoisomerase